MPQKSWVSSWFKPWGERDDSFRLWSWITSPLSGLQSKKKSWFGLNLSINTGVALVFSVSVLATFTANSSALQPYLPSPLSIPNHSWDSITGVASEWFGPFFWVWRGSRFWRPSCYFWSMIDGEATEVFFILGVLSFLLIYGFKSYSFATVLLVLFEGGNLVCTS